MINLLKLLLCLIQIPHHVIQGVEEHIFLIFGTRWRSVVNFTPASLTVEEEPPCALDRRVEEGPKPVSFRWTENSTSSGGKNLILQLPNP